MLVTFIMAAKGKSSSDPSTTANNSSNVSINVVNESFDDPAQASRKKSRWKHKRKINYYLSKEDIQFLIQNTRYTEQELR